MHQKIILKNLKKQNLHFEFFSFDGSTSLLKMRFVVDSCSMNVKIK